EGQSSRPAPGIERALRAIGRFHPAAGGEIGLTRGGIRPTKAAPMRFPLIAALLLAAGCEKLPVIQPPGFGGGETPQANSVFFFPSALAVLPDKTLLVANGNFSHAFAGGTLLSIKSGF